MRTTTGIDLETVKAVYAGPERSLWELIMGEQIHVGGLESSMALADAAGISPGSRGVDLCCCTGAGMRFLLRFRGVAHMTGVDATAEVLDIGRQRSNDDGCSAQIQFILADACQTRLDDACADFVWGEDAWCYVADKPRLICEAVRLVRPGGTVAFTDWVAGDVPMNDAEAERFLRFMKFPTFAARAEYAQLLENAGLRVERAEDTGRFPACIELYVSAASGQFGYDVSRLLGFDSALVNALGQEMRHMQALVHARKVVQAMYIARKPGALRRGEQP
ncbi:MAG: methyltransferase domain-containing protein [FCB group bacterium]|nr:methyltransferase domain-containing protein [FCB group bacterium]